MALSDGTRVKVNAQRDVWELCFGEFAGEQHFTFNAANRETQNAGKLVPSWDDWMEIIRTVKPDIDEDGVWKDDRSVRESFGLRLAGYHNARLNEHVYPGAAGVLLGSRIDGDALSASHWRSGDTREKWDSDQRVLGPLPGIGRKPPLDPSGSFFVP